MKFFVEKNKYNKHSLMKKLGYSSHPKNESFVRRLTANHFPRFHVYLTEKKEGNEISLHLDQKGVCYEGQTAHSGDYDSKVLNVEKERIINLIS